MFAEFVPPHHYHFFSLFLNFFFFFFKNLFFILPVSAIIGMSESIWSDVGVGGFLFVRNFESRLYSERCEVSFHGEIRRFKLGFIGDRCPLCLSDVAVTE